MEPFMCALCSHPRPFRTVHALRDHQRSKIFDKDHKICAICFEPLSSATVTVREVDLHYQKYHRNAVDMPLPAPQYHKKGDIACPGCDSKFNLVHLFFQHLEMNTKQQCSVIRVEDFEIARLRQHHQTIAVYNLANRKISSLRKIHDPEAKVVIKGRKIYAEKIGLGAMRIELPQKMESLEALTPEVKQRARDKFAATYPDHPEFRTPHCYNPTSSSWICPHASCLKAFDTENDLICHLRSLDHRRRQFSCYYCDKTYPRTHYLVAHLEQQECLAYKSPEHSVFMYQLTGGLVKTAGTLSKGSLKYTVVGDALVRLKARNIHYNSTRVVIWNMDLVAEDQSIAVLDLVDKIATEEARYRIIGTDLPAYSIMSDLAGEVDDEDDEYGPDSCPSDCCSQDGDNKLKASVIKRDLNNKPPVTRFTSAFDSGPAIPYNAAAISERPHTWKSGNVMFVQQQQPTEEKVNPLSNTTYPGVVNGLVATNSVKDSNIPGQSDVWEAMWKTAKVALAQKSFEVKQENKPASQSLSEQVAPVTLAAAKDDGWWW